MKKLLMLSRYFAPQNEIGAVRPTKLAKYLQLENGFSVSVLTCEDDFALRDSLLEADARVLSEVIQVSDGPLTRALKRFFQERSAKKAAKVPAGGGAAVTLVKESPSLAERLMANLNFIQEWLRNREYSRRLYKEIKPRLGEFDALWSTYSPIGCHLAALCCKRARRELFWIADYRDQPYRKKPGLLSEKIQSAANSRAVLKNADLITCASPGIPADMGWSGDKIQIMTNGFDADDFPKGTREPLEKLTITYTGGFYVEWQDPGELLRALRELADEGEVSLEKVEICYAGKEGAVLAKRAADYGLKGIVRDLGPLDRAESTALQARSALLFLVAVNMKSERSGMLTGKFLEYMGAGRPIVACIKGELENSIVKRYIDEGALGFCCEEAAGDASFTGLKRWLKAQYESVLKTGEPVFEPDRDFVESFNYKSLAKRLAAYFEKT
ncbi:MAG: hypothetical protein Q4B42_00390 [Oscillospiraceae bacterium]|nr:hypothetical protein [Oscillospiraceae bacterium]